MRNHRTMSRVILAFAAIAALSLGACASKPEKKVTSPEENMPSEFAGAPGWVVKGCAAYPGDDGKSRICGVGAAGGSNNPSMMRKAAVARARTEIARTLGVKVQSMLKDYQATTTGGEEFGTAAADEQHIVDVSKQITNFTLSGTEHRDTWISNSGTWYALVVLDLDKFKDSVGKMNNLSESIRKAVQERSKEAFDELDEAVDN